MVGMEIGVNSYELMARSSSSYLMRLSDQGKSPIAALVSGTLHVLIIGEIAVAHFCDSETLNGAEHGQP